jgi:hypothetical protein
MPPKFPIDYEPGKVQAFLISKETGQMIEATPLTEIAPKPWPIDDIEIETEPEPPKSLTLSGTFTLKTKMKANQRRKLIRALIGKQKLPRKLKKAGRHIYLPYSKPTIHDVVRQPDGTVCCIGYVSGYRIKPGYPHTKWARKALAKINRSVERSIKELFKNNEKPCHNT